MAFCIENHYLKEINLRSLYLNLEELFKIKLLYLNIQCCEYLTSMLFTVY